MGMDPASAGKSLYSLRLAVAASVASLALIVSAAPAQVNVVTAHNDIARTGQDLKETILTPSNVNPLQFGKLFSQTVKGGIYAQPLYVSQLAIPSNGTHNVVFVETNADIVYAFDADTNGGINAKPLWQTSLATGVLKTQFGVYGTPVIDLPSNTMFLVSSEVQGTTEIFRLHALDITTGAEKLGGPVPVQATIPGTGSGSSGGMLTFNPNYQTQRPGLLLLNGVLYVAFGSQGDNGVWHGWLFSFSQTTLQEISVFCTTTNGNGGGIWMGGAGLAAEVNDPTKPYGRMFVSTGNGSFSTSSPLTNTMSYGMSLLDLDLTGGVMTVTDEFTPYNEAFLEGEDGDLGSGGPVLLPTQTLASGATLNPLLEIGKVGALYIIDRNNLGGYNTTADQIVQEVQTPTTPGYDWGAGVWGSEAYWNNYIYDGGTNPALNSDGYNGAGNSLTAYSFINGVLSTTPVSKSAELFSWPSPTPSVSANGTNNGITWVIKTDDLDSLGPETLLAYNATNLAQTLYSSNDNLTRDSPGPEVEYVVPTIANGKVYVGAVGQVNIYGLLASTPVAPAPVISPGSGTFTTTQTVTITDGVARATIYYTTDGSTPNANSAVYSSTTPLVVSTNETITAIASPAGYLQSAPASATYVSTSTTANPTFSLAAGTYSGAQTLTMSDTSGGAVIYYTLNGSTPTTASTVYSNQPLTIPVSTIVNAIAVAPGLFASAATNASYTIEPAYAINFSQGFSLAGSSIRFNGSTELDDVRLQLTNGGPQEAGSAFYTTPVNIQAFTTDFTFQLSNPSADGITFTIQNVGPTALGAIGGSLGYAGIPNSVAIKFDLFSNAGEGPDSTGLYTNGATPTVPAINLTGTGIDLHSGDSIETHITYNGSTLYMTLTDDDTLATWSQSFAVNIPAIVGGNTAYVGFTGGTGGLSSSQKIISWTYIAAAPVPTFPAGFSAGSMTLNGGAAFNGTKLRLTDGGANEGRSAFFTYPVNVQEFTTSFQFQDTSAAADGFTFTIQGGSPTALGGSGGALGFWGIPNSVAVKFDLYSNAGEGADSTGLYLSGASPTIPFINLVSAGLNLHSGDIFNVQLSYNGSTLTAVITDTVTNVTATQTYSVDIPSIVGGLTAYVGFTGGTGGLTATQDILNWTYSQGIAVQPAFPIGFAAQPALMTMNGGSSLNGTRLRLTDGGAYEARSAFFSYPVNIQQFSTSFEFQLTNPNADGMTFTIQGNSPTALGSWGGGLGYAGIVQSAAVKFDLYSHAGEGANSTGLYTDGATPTVPAIDLSSTGINLHSGDLFNVQLTYDGTTLNVLITDTVTNASASQSYTVNIPSLVGGPMGYVGFSAGSGGITAIQEILNWSYVGGTS